MKIHVEVDASCEVEVEGVEYYVECTIKGVCYYEPAVLGGPPEDCHPEETECDLISIKIVSAESLLEGPESMDPKLRTKIELAIDEDWAIECLWEEFDALRQVGIEGE